MKNREFLKENIDYLFYALVILALILTSCSKEPEEKCFDCEIKQYIEEDGWTDHTMSKGLFCFPEDKWHNIEYAKFRYDSTDADGVRHHGLVLNCN